MKKQSFNNLIIGKKPVYEMLTLNPCLIKCIHLLKRDDYLINLCDKFQIPYIVNKQDHFFSSLNKDVNHQGYVLEILDKSNFLKIVDFDYLKRLSKSKNNLLVLMLDEIVDMMNFGAILRTAYAANVDAVIFKKDNQAQINDYIVKTSMGFINKIALLPVVNLSNAITKLKELNFWIFSSALNENAVNYDQLDYQQNVVLIIGNEKDGVSKLVIKNSDYLIKIPMFNNVDSLNVSVATGILLFNIISKRKNKGFI